MNELGLKNESLHHADLVFCRKLREECGLSWATTRASASAALVTARPLPPTPVPPPPPRPPPHRPLPLPPHFLLCPRMSMCRRLVLFLLKRQSRWLLLPCRCLSPYCCRPSITTSSLPTPATAALLAPPPPLPDPVAHNCPTPSSSPDGSTLPGHEAGNNGSGIDKTGAQVVRPMSWRGGW
jgi:hypothetical protein